LQLTQCHRYVNFFDQKTILFENSLFDIFVKIIFNLKFFNMEVKEATGRLGVLIPGLGAVATTLIAGVEAIKKGISQPIGSITQMGNIHLNRKAGSNYPKIKDFVPLANLEDIVFGGWDVYEDNVYTAASRAKVLEPHMLEALRPQLEALKPMKAVFDKSYIRNLDGTHVKEAATKFPRL